MFQENGYGICLDVWFTLEHLYHQYSKVRPIIKAKLFPIDSQSSNQIEKDILRETFVHQAFQRRGYSSAFGKVRIMKSLFNHYISLSALVERK